MPVRVEKRRAPDGLYYRIVGIVWGGSQPISRLAIRFGADDSWTTFPICPPPSTANIWSLWEHRWRPRAAGRYAMSLRVPDPSIPQRRLDSGYYVRHVDIQEA